MEEFVFDARDPIHTMTANKYLEPKVILGIDIYKYSQYNEIEQFYIPILFNTLYIATVKKVLEFEPFIFSQYGNELTEFENNFISTGDGGFQIFNNPIECIVFAIYFQTIVKQFLSGSNTTADRKKLREIIEDFDLRYAITSDKIYHYNSNFYGPGIISNARILSKDTLNRLLIDAHTMHWFTNNINSVENLLDITKATFNKTKCRVGRYGHKYYFSCEYIKTIF